MLHKGLSLIDIDSMPYFRFMSLVDTWQEEIKEEKDGESSQSSGMMQQQSSMMNNMSLPKFDMPKFDMPKF